MEIWRDWIKEWFEVGYDHVFISFLPNKDKDENEFDVEPWETKALELQGRFCGLRVSGRYGQRAHERGERNSE